MNKKCLSVFVVFLLTLSSINVLAGNKRSSMKDAFGNKFLIGVAMNSSQIREENKKQDKLILKHFNSIVAENCMKSERIQPKEGEFNFVLPDKFVAYGQKHRMFMVGHTLIWHSQAPKWFFVDEKGEYVSREVLIERMRTHITTIVNRYKGKVMGWDVVNEAINDNGTWRESPFYKIIGREYVKLAFQFAHEADPNAELYYNDYNMAIEAKRNAVVEMVKDLRREGVKIAGIGMQGHLGMDFPTITEFEKSIVAFSQVGAEVMITELDLSILPSPWSKTGANVSDTASYQERMNPYKTAVPADIYTQWEEVYAGFFKLFLKHSDRISRVTFWGLSDADSWKNDWPIAGRTDYPLLFDRDCVAKPVVQKIINKALHSDK